MAVLEFISQTIRSYAVLFAGLILLGRFIYNYRKLSHLPGPILAGCTDLWRFVHCIRQQANTEYKLHRQYGSPLIRLGPITVSVADPRAIPIIYGLKPIYNKGYLYITHQFMNENGEIMHNLSSTRDEGIHARLRRAISGAYAMTNVLDYEPLMDRTTDEFFRILTERFVETGDECPLAEWLQYFAFDVLGEITFSKRFGFMEAGEDVEHMLYHTANHMEYLGHIGQLPIIDEYFRLRNGLFRRLIKINAIVTFTARHIAEHSRHGGKPDFVDRFEEAAEKYPDIITPAQLQDYAVTNVSAGSDTTAIVFRSLIYHLLTDSRVYATFIEEVKSVVQARPQDDNFNKHISWIEARQMTYTQACLKEALRLHPPLGQILPRVVPPGGIIICGQYLKEGTEVGCNAWTVHRDSTVFGEDPDSFRPERWLDIDTEGVKDMERYMFSFGAGSRTCIGRHVAILELSKVIPEFFRTFEVSLVDPTRYTNKAGWLVVQSGLDVLMTKRDPREFIANVGQ